jgi:hypothetical protein
MELDECSKASKDLQFSDFRSLRRQRSEGEWREAYKFVFTCH